MPANAVQGLRIAIVCDWLLGIGGAEQVVLELHKMFPDAPIYTSQYDSTKIDWFKDADVRTTWLQKLPVALKKFLPPLRAWAFSHLKLVGYDLVISASGAEAKGVHVPNGTIHISYCHSPTHYYWIRYDEYLKHPGFGIFDPLARLGLKLLVGSMRHWDYKAAQRPDFMVANSTHTQAMIKKFYGRNSTVIHPPVDIVRFQSKSVTKRHGLVTAGRQTPYKRIDLAVATCTKLGLFLTVIGDGPDHKKLIKMAGSTIKFVTDTTGQKIPGYFQSAEAFIFPGLEDFGIVAAEAMAAGTPVIAFRAGGALDYVQPAKTGEFFAEQTIDSLTEILKKFDSNQYNHQQIAATADQFNIDNFRQKITRFINNLKLG